MHAPLRLIISARPGGRILQFEFSSKQHILAVSPRQVAGPFVS